jgi:hypothetical protein
VANRFVLRAFDASGYESWNVGRPFVCDDCFCIYGYVLANLLSEMLGGIAFDMNEPKPATAAARKLDEELLSPMKCFRSCLNGHCTHMGLQFRSV